MERLKTLYLGLPASLRARVPPGLEAWGRARLAAAGRVGWLEDRLWGGFSRPALAGLEALAADPAAPPRQAAAAALALARWHGARGETALALVRAREALARDPRLVRDRSRMVVETLMLCRLGCGGEARARLDAPGRWRPRFDPTLALMRANTWNPAAGAPDADPERALAALNAVLARAGLAALARRDPAAPLGLDNLAAAAPLTARPRGGPAPLVTVIVPLWNAAATIGTALASLAAQTHAELEVLVVDDASTDAGPGIVETFARADPRFRLLRQEANRGPYAARNRALAAATGAFVTVQDADDWSHPERIARHLADLAARGAPYNISDWARADDTLVFQGPWRPGAGLIGQNFASLFFRRDLVERCGPWDTARVSADRELAARIARICGTAPPRSLLAGIPLGFGRAGPGSLTRAPATHAATLLHGIRREYREAAAIWHQGLDPARIRAEGWRAAPPWFPAPRPVRADGPEPRHDLLFIADFNLRGGAFHSAMHMARAAHAAGLDVGLLHYRRYDLDPTRPLAAEVRREAAERGWRIVAPGERVFAHTVVVTYPALLDQPMDRFPEVAHERLVVTVNQMAERDRAGTDVAYDPAQVRAHLAELLGSEGLWAPISERVRALMAADPRYPAPFADTWTPLIDLATWEGPLPRPGSDRPVLGRHGRDHPLKWPRNPAALAAAYAADRPCAVRFLGGAATARARLGRWPRNWSAEPFGARDVRDFLAGLDVFVHHPDPDYVEEFGRAPMEAMAAGVPVILPPEFEPTFGAAALYAPPEAVWPLVERLRDDRAFREARVAAGRGFVAATCGYDALPRRLARLAPAAPVPAAEAP